MEESIRENIQYGVSDEQYQYTKRYKREAAHIDQTSFGEDVAFPLVLLIRVGIVQPVVLFHVFGE
mgnify:CR=1 FL=1